MSNCAVVAYGGTTRTRRPTGHESPPGLSEPAPKASPQKKRRRSRPRKVGQQQGSQVTPFLVAGLVGEVIVLHHIPRLTIRSAYSILTEFTTT